jgi:hypothetical protein
MIQLKNKLTRGIPEWQSKKMRMIIADRWLETWEVVETRDIEKRNSVLRAMVSKS